MKERAEHEREEAQSVAGLPFHAAVNRRAGPCGLELAHPPVRAWSDTSFDDDVMGRIELDQRPADRSQPRVLPLEGGPASQRPFRCLSDVVDLRVVLGLVAEIGEKLEDDRGWSGDEDFDLGSDGLQSGNLMNMGLFVLRSTDAS